MFNRARLKLTGWYLVIILCICVAFSGAIYRFTTMEVERFARLQRYQFQRDLRTGMPSPIAVPLIDPKIVAETQKRVLITLGIVDGLILFVTGMVGFVVAGKTLQPIQQMMNEQNRFVSDASHELRTPLTALKATFEVSLRDKQLTLLQAKTLLKDSLKDVNSLQRLSDGLLQLVRTERTNVGGKPEEVEVKEIVTTARKRLAGLATEKKLTINESGETVKVWGDREKLLQMVTIFMDNAVKYSHEGGSVEVKVGQTRANATLEIADSGMGIAEEDIPHIFDRFFRANSARTREEQGGYGLGLAIAKKIIDEHGGTVRVKSQLSKFTVFTIELPKFKKRGFSLTSGA